MKPTPSHFTVQKAHAISQYLDLNLEMPNRMIIRKELEAIISSNDPYADISAAVLTTYDPEIVSFLIQEQGEAGLTCIRNAKGKPLPWHELDPLKWTTSGFFELAKVAGHIEADAFNRAQWRAFRQFIQRAKHQDPLHTRRGMEPHPPLRNRDPLFQPFRKARH